MDDPIVQLTTPLRSLSVSGGPRPGVIERVHPAPTAAAPARDSAANDAATIVAQTPSPVEVPPATEPAPAPLALSPPWTVAMPTETLIQPAGFVLPGSTGAAWAWPLPWGFMWTPAAPFVDQSLTLHRSCVRCAHCNAAVNPFVTVELRVGTAGASRDGSRNHGVPNLMRTGIGDLWWLLGAGTWTCVFCGGSNTHPEQFADSDPQSYPELGTKVVEYVEPDAQVRLTAASDFVRWAQLTVVAVLAPARAPRWQINWNALGVGLATPPIFLFVVDEVMAAANREVRLSGPNSGCALPLKLMCVVRMMDVG